MGIIIAAGVFIGHTLDQRFINQYKGFTIFFSLLFIGLSIYYVIQQVSKHSNTDRNNTD